MFAYICSKNDRTILLHIFFFAFISHSIIHIPANFNDHILIPLFMSDSNLVPRKSLIFSDTIQGVSDCLPHE